MVVKVKTTVNAGGIKENFFKEGTLVTRIEPTNTMEKFLDENGMYIFEGEAESGGILRQSLEPREYEIVK